MPGPGSKACPKPEPRKRAKARKDRQEAAALAVVRKQVNRRDGEWSCRVAFARALIGPCSGRITLAHLWEKRRFKTRGMPPEQRHEVTSACNMCQHHHQGPRGYDAHGFEIEALTERGADGRLRVTKRVPLTMESTLQSGAVLGVERTIVEAHVDEADS